jgi:hypothetical protein
LVTGAASQVAAHLERVELGPRLIERILYNEKGARKQVSLEAEESVEGELLISGRRGTLARVNADLGLLVGGLEGDALVAVDHLRKGGG